MSLFNRDTLFSVVLHSVVIAVTIWAGPMDIRKPPQFGEVIRVGVVSMPEIAPAPAEPIPDAPTPQALEAEPEDIPIQDPATRPSVEIDEKPKPPPEPEKKPEPQVTNQDAQTSDRDRAGSGDGEQEVDAPAGSGISGVTVDNAAFNYPYWFTQAFTKLSRNFRIPIVIDGKIECRVYFQVIKSGRVIESKVTESSGIPQFDEACLAAIERAAPFPPLPREFLDEIIGINLTFTN